VEGAIQAKRANAAGIDLIQQPAAEDVHLGHATAHQEAGSSYAHASLS
jgi:hypothetical protein